MERELCIRILMGIMSIMTIFAGISELYDYYKQPKGIWQKYIGIAWFVVAILLMCIIPFIKK